jgi:S-layer homology domain
MRSILRQIVAVLALVGIVTTMVPSTFAVTYTAQAAADKLAASGFIVDQSANSAAYRLADNLLRQEAVGTAANVLGLLTTPLSSYVCQNKFSDVTAASGWVCRAAELAAAAGLTNAANATFRPKDNLTRFEALVFALRAAGLVPSEGLTQAALIQLGVDNGLITSSAGFNASAAATRGEFFQYVVRGLDAAETPELCDILGICPTPTPTPTPTSGTVSAMIGNGNPASGTLVAGQAIANLAHFAFVNNSTSDVKITNVKVNRIGVSADETLVNTYLYDGVSRITDAASVSTGLITFNDSTGLFTIPAKSTKVVAVRSDIKTGTSGQTVGVSLSSFTVMGGTAQAVSVAGNIHTVATATLATVDFNTTTTPATTTITPQEDYTMWQNVVSVGVREVWLRSFKLRQVGSVNNSDLANFRLYVDGQMVGGAVANLDSNGYVTFDLSTPLKLQTGSRTIKMLGTIVNGSSRNFSFSLRQASDAMFVDDQYNVVVLPTANSSTFSARSTGTQTIDSGSLTFTKATNSPSGDTVKDASGVVLARYEVKAYGEMMKVENLSVAVVESDSDTAFTLRNGALFLDGAQIGSTAAIAATTDSTLGYTNFTFGSSFIVTPGTTRILEIRADIYDNDGTNDVAADDTLTARIIAGSTNVQRMTSLGYGSYPAAVVAANQLTVKTGSLTVAKDTSVASSTVVPSKTGLLIAKYNIQASTSEGSNITSVTVDPTNSSTDAFDASDDLTNMYIKVGNYTSPVKSSVDDDSNVFSTNINIAAGQTVSVEVYADVATGATDGDGTADTGTTTIDVAYTTLASATSTTSGAITGQVITYGTGSFATAVDGSSPVARSVSGNQVVTAAAYKFTATNESYTIKEVTVKVGSAAIGSVVSSVQLYDGATPVGAPVALTQSSNTAALITGLNIAVPSNTVKVLTAKFTLNTIGTGAGTSGSNAALTLDSVKYSDSQGVEATEGTDRAGNALLVYKAVPTVAQVTVDTTTKLVNGTARDLYKVTITAPSASVSANGVTVKQIRLATTWNDGAYDGTAGGGNDDILEVESLKLILDGSDITSSDVTIQDQAGNSAESTSGLTYTEGAGDSYVVISWDTTKELSIGAGQTRTLTLRGTPQGFNVIDAATTPTDSVGFALNADASAQTAAHTYLNGLSSIATIWGLHDSAASTGSGEVHNFIWSDVSANPHATAENASSSADWTNGYKVFDDFGVSQLGM